MSIRCSETYAVKTAQLSVWGIPLWYTSSSPRSIIQVRLDIVLLLLLLSCVYSSNKRSCMFVVLTVIMLSDVYVSIDMSSCNIRDFIMVYSCDVVFCHYCVLV